MNKLLVVAGFLIVLTNAVLLGFLLGVATGNKNAVIPPATQPAATQPAVTMPAVVVAPEVKRITPVSTPNKGAIKRRNKWETFPYADAPKCTKHKPSMWWCNVCSEYNMRDYSEGYIDSAIPAGD